MDHSDHYPALLLLRRRELGRLRLWWLWLQQRLREQLLLRRQYNSRTANRQTCRGVFSPRHVPVYQTSGKEAEHMHRCTTALYFSPTGGTRTYVRAVAAAMPHMGGEVDLTRPEERRKVHMFGADDVVVLGVPVYYGRVPEVPGLLDGLQGEETPAVLLAVYGNRLIDDALAELSDLCAARGFRPLAAGAFVAPHTFSAKVAMGRPNAGDLAAAAELGRRAAEKLSGPVRWRPSILPRPVRPTVRSASAAWPVSGLARRAADGWKAPPLPLQRLIWRRH